MTKKKGSARAALKPKTTSGEVDIWKYMSFAKLASLLTSKTLWLSRLDLLGDPFEGTSPYAVDSGETKTDDEELTASYLALRRWMLASCWYMAENESDAMWRLYSSLEDGIAVRSKIHRLLSAIGQSADAARRKKEIGEKLVGAAITYGEYDSAGFDADDPFARFLFKRSAFAHEREFRILTTFCYGSRELPQDSEPPSLGVALDIDPTTLLEEIVVSPLAPEWYGAAVVELVNTFAPGLKVRRSVLSPPRQFWSDAGLR